MKHTLFIGLAVFLVTSCQSNAQKTTSIPNKSNEKVLPVEVPEVDGLKKAYFASGCFWCVEAIYESIKGVEEVISGYSGGHTQNPSYESSNTGRTGHAEAVEVLYDPNIISFETLIDIYFDSQNPTQVNGQGPDRGSQYRSIIFYQNEKQKEIAISKKNSLSKKLGSNVAAEIKPFQKFWIAEAYHQDYEKNHPNHPYILNVSIPRLKRFSIKNQHLLKNKHPNSH